MTTQASAFSLAAPSVATPFRRRHRNPLLVRAAAVCFQFDDLLTLRFCRNNFLILSVEPSDKSVEIMRKFSEQYARKSGTYFCVDKGVTSVVIKKLNFSFLLLDVHDFPVLNQDFPRHYDDKAAEAAQGFWNCPCVPMRERKECHCMLFLTPDNDFAGDEQAITLEEIKESTANM
ncbi:Ferredoxin-thioredoxin reductase catalytic chain [Vigna angularis]|uniref:Ferredoxin-thioredoxin reductase catalytic chain, chloroplastic n=1 Tax=Phaseolus angularis TaxID=3914 RepID=A0A8T0JU41_PHAAN|nr:Ferredoxin-thioredoxin reductase catalytic chain [Vigna angularis]